MALPVPPQPTTNTRTRRQSNSLGIVWTSIGLLLLAAVDKLPQGLSGIGEKFRRKRNAAVCQAQPQAGETMGWLVSRTAPEGWVKELEKKAVSHSEMLSAASSCGIRMVPVHTKPFDPSVFQ